MLAKRIEKRMLAPLDANSRKESSCDLERLKSSNNGTEFKNRILDNYLEERGVTHTTIPPYWAQANPIERVNRTLKTMMVSFIEGNHRKWDEHIPELMFAYNTSVQESTGISPAFLNMGRNPTPPKNFRRQDERAAVEEDDERAQLEWRDRIARLREVHEIAATNSRKAQERQAKYYNAKRTDAEYAIGQRVLKRNRILSSGAQGVAAKLAPKFAGPYKVSARLGSNVYELVTEGGRIIGKVHVADLKPFHQGGEKEDSEENSNEDETTDQEVREENDECDASASVAQNKVGRPRKSKIIVCRKETRKRKSCMRDRTRPLEATDKTIILPTESDAECPIPHAPKRKPGRPKGSKRNNVENIEQSPRRTRAQRRQVPS